LEIFLNLGTFRGFWAVLAPNVFWGEGFVFLLPSGGGEIHGLLTNRGEDIRERALCKRGD